MSAIATIPAAPLPAAMPVRTAVVLVDGAPEPRLWVAEVVMDGPDDRRHAVLAWRGDAAPRQRLASATAQVLWPLRLSDGKLRLVVLVEGRLTASDQRWRLDDAWNALLDRSVATVWRESDAGLLVDDAPPARLEVGEHGNRSMQTWPINGSAVHVPSATGDTWRVGDALATLAAFASVNLSLALLPDGVRRAPLLRPIDLARPLGDGLRSVLDDYDLVVQRDRVYEAGRTIERRSVRVAEQGRRVRIAWAEPSPHIGQGLRITARPGPDAASHWAAVASGWRVEGTFPLLPVWNPALEGEADATYSRVNNADFAAYADVFRFWALNEDGMVSGQPAFDAGAFFDDEPLTPRPLRLLNCLTLTDAGLPRPPIVEMSTDAGETWLPYPDVARISNERAAIYLDDATLPAAFLAAGQSGDARLRVTACLQDPRPVRIGRWRGNPFAGLVQRHELNVRGVFRFARVSPASIHHNAVRDGEFAAAEADDTLAMRRWLIERTRRNVKRQGGASLTLGDVQPMFRVGDQALGAVEGCAAVVERVRCRWEGVAGPTTVLELSF